MRKPTRRTEDLYELVLRVTPVNIYLNYIFGYEANFMNRVNVLVVDGTEIKLVT